LPKCGCEPADSKIVLKKSLTVVPIWPFFENNKVCRIKRVEEAGMWATAKKRAVVLLLKVIVLKEALHINLKRRKKDYET